MAPVAAHVVVTSASAVVMVASVVVDRHGAVGGAHPPHANSLPNGLLAFSTALL